MQKLSTFIRIKTANLNGRLISLFLVFCGVPCVAHGASGGLVCADCYRCTYGSAGDCHGTCEYDENYCMHPCPDGQVWNPDSGECIGLVVTPCQDVVCSDSHVLNYETCTCECPSSDFAQFCQAGYTFSDETCQCEKDKCNDGYYFSESGCAKCPDFTGSSSSGLISLSCGVHSSNDGQNGITDCYKMAIKIGSLSGGAGPERCSYSDDTGTYEFSSNCYYSIFADIVGENVGGIK